ncbi:uncharacterized protein FIBRA_06143 [Fibroporia radiculosa]|uniref:Cyclin-domain-containing protein n=1 Tax=Fibroporia radiculosa TaxID=599839 RepID=J4HYN1_9APHY|nr:uncharacterized protein FIBRA_06143 [Fibroporia radiculosa]CCM03987.1 predicted protein [Fibroporia radiculosa]
MLALAHPMQHTATLTTVDHPLRPQSSSSSSASRSARPSQRKLHSSIILPSSSRSSSYLNLTAPPPNRPDPSEVSSHRFAPPSSLSSSQPLPIHHQPDEDDAHTPPASDAEDNEPVQPDTSGTDVHTYEPETLLRMLATALRRMAELNANTPAEAYGPSSSQSQLMSSQHHKDQRPPVWWSLTTASRHSLSTTSSLAFHARNVPTIALEGYLTRIHKYCPASNEVFVSLLVYLDRMTRLAKEACGKAFPIDMYNIHRLIIAGVTVASKFFSDVFYTNSRYAKVGGLPLAELNQLELQFLLLNDFHLTISCEEMEYFTKMVDLQSRIPDDVDLFQYLPSQSTASRAPIGPTDFFAAVDSYFGQRHRITRPAVRSRLSDDHDDMLPYSPSFRSASDAASEAGTETDFDCSTDDEPTIRPPHSSASSETMSLRSTASGDADSIYTDDGDMSRDEEDVMLERAAGTPGRERMIMRTPS